MRLKDADKNHFTTKQDEMTKRLVACNPIVSETYGLWARASLMRRCVEDGRQVEHL
jgi:hypothetical protein